MDAVSTEVYWAIPHAWEHDVVKGKASETRKNGINDLSGENLRSYITRINKQLESTFLEYAYAPVIKSIGIRPNTKYGITLSSKNVEFVDINLVTLQLFI